MGDNVFVPQCRAFKHLFTKIRDKDTSPLEFRTYAKRIMSMICEEGIAELNPASVDVTTPTGCVFNGERVDTSKIVVVSIVRAADSMLDCFLELVPEAAVGKILIQRNEETAEPQLFYDKLPPLAGKTVVLLDPMLATGGSALCAVKVLLEQGAKIEDITFFNVVSCPEGLARFAEEAPGLKVVTGCIDEKLNEQKYIVPGLGDYGDRFFNSV
jgi:uracil phosphoribosyltransferase